MSLKPITHTAVRTTFKVNPRNGIAGSLSRMFKPQHVTQQIGELFETIVKQIFEDKTAFAYKAPFSLVNMTNLLQFSSVGYSQSPPKQVLGVNPGLVFTFALSASPYRDTAEITRLNQNYDGTDLVTYWTDDNRNRYLTIAIDKSTLRDVKVSINTTPEMVYVYNCIGVMTKSYILQNNWYIGPSRNYHPVNSGMDESSTWSKYLEKSIRTMFNDQAMNTWIYCLEFWTRCPNLLTPSFINIDEFGLYYVLYLHERVPVNRSTIYQSLHSRIGGMQDYITRGIQDFNRALNNPASDISDNCYAVVHLLEALVEPGGIGIVVDRDYARDRINQMARVFESNNDLASAFYGFLNSSSAYNHLMDSSDSFARVMEKIL